jgi:hypothetical protein
MSANVEARALFQSAIVAERCANDDAVAELPEQLERLRRDRHQIFDSLDYLHEQAV